MIKVHYTVQDPRHERSEPVIDGLVSGHGYYPRDGVFQLEYWVQEDTGQPPNLYASQSELDRIRRYLPGANRRATGTPPIRSWKNRRGLRRRCRTMKRK